MRKHKVTREDKAEARIAEAIRAGVVLHWSAGHEDGTVGPNRDAVPLAKRQFALHSYKSGYRGQTESRFYETAEQAAYGMLARTGVTNAIAALKKAAAKRDLRYSNLDTPIPWGQGLRLNSGRPARRNSADRVPEVEVHEGSIHGSRVFSARVVDLPRKYIGAWKLPQRSEHAAIRAAVESAREWPETANALASLGYEVKRVAPSSRRASAPLRSNVGYDLSYARRIGYPFTVALAWTDPFLDFPAERVFRVQGRDGRQWGVYESKSEAQAQAQAKNRAVEQGQRLPMLENPRPPRRRNSNVPSGPAPWLSFAPPNPFAQARTTGDTYADRVKVWNELVYLYETMKADGNDKVADKIWDRYIRHDNDSRLPLSAMRDAIRIAEEDIAIWRWGKSFAKKANPRPPRRRTR